MAKRGQRDQRNTRNNLVGGGLEGVTEPLAKAALPPYGDAFSGIREKACKQADILPRCGEGDYGQEQDVAREPENGSVELSEPIVCPFCGRRFDLVVDTSAGSHQFTTDCEVCCRPLEVRVECEPGRILAMDVAGES
jgi:hypothetical protein